VVSKICLAIPAHGLWQWELVELGLDFSQCNEILRHALVFVSSSISYHHKSEK